MWDQRQNESAKGKKNTLPELGRGQEVQLGIQKWELLSKPTRWATACEKDFKPEAKGSRLRLNSTSPYFFRHGRGWHSTQGSA